MSQVATLSRELRIIRKSFRQLAGVHANHSSTHEAQPRIRRRHGAVRRPRRLTASHRAALKLQGKYLGTMRGLKPRQRVRVKRIRAAKGIRAAIAAARRMTQ